MSPVGRDALTPRESGREYQREMKPFFLPLESIQRSLKITRPVCEKREEGFKMEDEMTERREDDSQFDHEKVTLDRTESQGLRDGSDERREKTARKRKT